jgi:hypothetical protein
MADEHAIARYRHWYRKLLRFYSKPYRERFGESMEQTFNDLCRERAEAGKGLVGFALWVFVETSAGIIREHVRFINMQKAIIRIALGTGLILLIPLFGNLFIDGWNWPWTAFAFFGVVLFSAGLAYELAGKYAKTGVISGFVFGEMVACGVIATLRYLNPNDDVAGVVIITFLICGLFFAFVGYLIQNYLKRK